MVSFRYFFEGITVLRSLSIDYFPNHRCALFVDGATLKAKFFNKTYSTQGVFLNHNSLWEPYVTMFLKNKIEAASLDLRLPVLPIITRKPANELQTS